MNGSWKNRISWYDTDRWKNGLRLNSHWKCCDARHPVEIDDRRREEPERQQVREQVADVAKVDGQRRQDQRQPEREDELDR